MSQFGCSRRSAARGARRFARALLLPALILSAIMLAACGEADPDAPEPMPVHIGIIQSLSGIAGAYGTSSYQGMQLAFAEIIAETENELLITRSIIDDQSDPEISREIMEELLLEEPSAIIGPTLSGVAYVVHPLAQQHSVVALSPTTTAAGITETGDHIFSLALTEARVVPEVVAYVTAEHGVGQAVMFWDSSEGFSPFSSSAMRDGLRRAGGTMVLELDLAAHELDEAIARLKGVDFDLVFISPLLDVSVTVIEALRAAGHEQIVIGGNSFNTPEISEQAGEAVEGTYVGAAWNSRVRYDASRRFVNAYETAYETTPDQFAAQGYTAVYVLIDAIRRAGSSDPEAIRAALADTHDLETPLGSFSFNDLRQGEHEPVIQRYVNGTLQIVGP